jgi:hypothetical protein
MTVRHRIGETAENLKAAIAGETHEAPTPCGRPQPNRLVM